MRLFDRQRSSHTSPTQNGDDNLSFEDQASTLIPAEVRMISGCHSEQTSADVANVNNIASLPNPAGRAGGACTVALLEILYRNHTISFQSLLLQLRESLSKKGMSQIPQLTSSRPLEMQETPFSLCDGPGKRRALLVGINYVGQNPGQLSGCHNDILNMKKYLIECQGYSAKNILILMDDGKHIFPSRQKIILGLQQLVQQSKSGDNAYFHYSGHGGLLDPEGFNAFKMNQKGYDETLYPVDHDRAGQIRDFSLFHHFVKPMPAGVKVTCVMDCCHSGSVLDLPYNYKPTAGGTIAMQRSMNNLSNLAFLYILAGGMLPHHGFHNVTDNLQNNVDGDLDGYQGVGVEEIQEADMVDDSAVQQATEYTGDQAYEGVEDDNMMGDVGGGDVDPGEFGGESAVRGDDIDQGAFGGADYEDPGGLLDAQPYSAAYPGAEEGVGGSTFADVYGGGGFEDTADATGGDCDCGEGLGDILGAILDGGNE